MIVDFMSNRNVQGSLIFSSIKFGPHFSNKIVNFMRAIARKADL